MSVAPAGDADEEPQLLGGVDLDNDPEVPNLITATD
jgi:hypothetical protein